MIKDYFCTYLTSIKISILILVISGTVSAETVDKAKTKTSQWELGIGAGVLDIPLYPGSSQNKTYFLPIPHILYRSENLEIDNGLQATFLRTQKVRVDISADIGVPVNSQESTLRQGMPDIDLVLQFGPSLEITLDGGRFEPNHTRLELPVRAAIATDFSSAEHVGWIFEPRLTFETRRPEKTGFAYLLSGGLRFATEDYNDYYNAVDQKFSTPEKPAFDSGGGYSGLFVDAIANWRTRDLIFFAFVRYQNLTSSEFEDSPLVEQNDYYFIGAGMTWVFARNI